AIRIFLNMAGSVAHRLLRAARAMQFGKPVLRTNATVGDQDFLKHGGLRGSSPAARCARHAIWQARAAHERHGWRSGFS
ncbi:MAG: hypothetical protein M0Q87_02680, partial [Ottowia sp.]|nr:hypothetical protein [Ottowia sp.]